MIGLKVRENYECPGSTVLIAAHRDLEALVTTHAERAFKAHVDQQWAETVYRGLWWEPFMGDLNAFIGSVQSRVNGWGKLRLFKGGLQVTSRGSDQALYSEAAASFDDVDELEQSKMTGMVQTHGMESLLYSKLMGKRRSCGAALLRALQASWRTGSGSRSRATLRFGGRTWRDRSRTLGCWVRRGFLRRQSRRCWSKA